MPTLAERLPQTEAAVAYAERLHLGQRQGDGTPYLLHPLEVARLLGAAGAPDHLIAAGALHDVLEKSDARESDLRKRFGSRITDLVLAVSDDNRITSYAHRKAALRQQVASAGDDAMTLLQPTNSPGFANYVERLRLTATDPDPRPAPDTARPSPAALPALARDARGTPTGVAAGAGSPS